MQRQNRKSPARHPGHAPLVERHGVLGRAIALKRRHNPQRFIVCMACLMIFGVFFNPMTADAETNKSIFRVGFSKNMFSEINENDAMAAFKVWTAMIAKDRGVPTDPTPYVYNDVQDMGQALTAKKVDSIALTSEEYWKLRPLLDSRTFIVGSNDESFIEEYIVLTHKDSKIHRVEDLRGRSLSFFQNSRTGLAPIWMDTVLLKAGFPRTQEFCRVTVNSKLAKTVLPVFFRQADACVVTRSSFKTMCELNPQLGQHLKVILSSPELVPSGFCFRRDYNDSIRQMIIKELTQVMASSGGNQIMTLFQLGKFEAKPLSCLDSAFELLATHERLLGKTKMKN